MAYLYFNAAVNNNWNTVGNWWEDAGFTVPANRRPGTGDDVFISNDVTSNSGPIPTVSTLVTSRDIGIPIIVTNGASFVDLGLPPASLKSLIVGPCAFSGLCYVDATGIVIGNCTFNDYSYVLTGGAINGNCTFNGISYLAGAVSGDCAFYTLASLRGAAPHAGSITGRGDFYNSAFTSGTVNGVAVFDGANPTEPTLPSYNEGTITSHADFINGAGNLNNGTVSGNGVFRTSGYNLGVVVGNALFEDYNNSFPTASSNYGLVQGNAEFKGNAQNAGASFYSHPSQSYSPPAVWGTTKFYDSTVNFGAVGANPNPAPPENRYAEFYGSAYNGGSCGGNAYFAVDAANYVPWQQVPPAAGSVAGTATFNRADFNANSTFDLMNTPNALGSANNYVFDNNSVSFNIRGDNGSTSTWSVDTSNWSFPFTTNVTWNFFNSAVNNGTLSSLENLNLTVNFDASSYNSGTIYGTVSFNGQNGSDSSHTGSIYGVANFNANPGGGSQSAELAGNVYINANVPNSGTAYFSGTSYDRSPVRSGANAATIWFTSPVTFYSSAGYYTSENWTQDTTNWVFVQGANWVFTGLNNTGIIGPATFYTPWWSGDYSGNSGTVNGAGYFEGYTSFNSGTVNGAASFNYGAFNSDPGSVNGNATFNGSYNYGNVYGDTEFIYDGCSICSANQGTTNNAPGQLSFTRFKYNASNAGTVNTYYAYFEDDSRVVGGSINSSSVTWDGADGWYDPCAYYYGNCGAYYFGGRLSPLDQSGTGWWENSPLNAGNSAYYVNAAPTSLNSSGNGVWNNKEYIAGYEERLLYFANTVNGDWSNGSNWWLDATLTTPLSSLNLPFYFPRAIDTVVITEGANVTENSTEWQGPAVAKALKMM